MIDWLCTPATPQRTRIAPSSTRSAALHLDGEVDVAGRVDDVDRMVLPGDVSRGRGDRDATLALEFHRVHRGTDAILAADLVDRVDETGIEKDAFGQRGLARVDVGADPDVPELGEIESHEFDPNSWSCTGLCRHDPRWGRSREHSVGSTATAPDHQTGVHRDLACREMEGSFRTRLGSF